MATANKLPCVSFPVGKWKTTVLQLISFHLKYIFCGFIYVKIPHYNWSWLQEENIWKQDFYHCKCFVFDKGLFAHFPKLGAENDIYFRRKDERKKSIMMNMSFIKASELRIVMY